MTKVMVWYMGGGRVSTPRETLGKNYQWKKQQQQWHVIQSWR